MATRIERIMIALMFALLAAGITLVVANALGAEPQPDAQFTSNCTSCHTEYQMTWESGAHGQAGDDPVFVEHRKHAGYGEIDFPADDPGCLSRPPLFPVPHGHGTDQIQIFAAQMVKSALRGIPNDITIGLPLGMT